MRHFEEEIFMSPTEQQKCLEARGIKVVLDNEFQESKDRIQPKSLELRLEREKLKVAITKRHIELLREKIG